MCTVDVMNRQRADWFQFPSNGKAHVSSYRIPINDQQSFNSLQTGKHMCTRWKASCWWQPCSCFNSLQTGSTGGSSTSPRRQVSIPFKRGKHMCTSIPFKRESTCAQKPTIVRCKVNGFNSLQTGKHMCTFLKMANSVCSDEVVFQFPSNGKAHVHFNFIFGNTHIVICSFNSLQTGKHMCTCILFGR